jgi:AraC family transcriptional regulator
MTRLKTPSPNRPPARIFRPLTRTAGEVKRGAFGSRMAKHFHVESETAFTVPMAHGNPLAVTRVRSPTGLVEATSPIPPEKASLVLLQLRDVPAHELWLDGRSTQAAFWPNRSVSVVDLTREPRAFVPDPFDTLQFYVPHSAVDEIAEEAGISHVKTLSWPEGSFDPIVHHLGEVILEILARPEQADTLLLSHLGCALISHFVHAYGGIPPTSIAPIGGLAPWQERRSKELMIESVKGNISLSTLAAECGLSRSYFSRAFKKTTG